MIDRTQSCLYGIYNSNRSNNDLWGKNQFNSSFPVALACYMRDTNIPATYLRLDENLRVVQDTIPINEVFNTTLPNERLYFEFESHYQPYQRYATGDIGGIDLVVKDNNMEYLRPLEIKLTVVPDNTTVNLPEEGWGPEIVIRPATTKYCALGIADACLFDRNNIRAIFEPIGGHVQHWDNISEIYGLLPSMIERINFFERSYYQHQKPMLLQPIWRTQGQSPLLAENAFDIFVWSDFAVTRLFMDRTNITALGTEPRGNTPPCQTQRNIIRTARSAARFFNFMYHIFCSGTANLNQIYTQMSFDRQTDKEFSVNGITSRRFIDCNRLNNPILPRTILSSIFLNGGENNLRPERRFDQTLYFAYPHESLEIEQEVAEVDSVN